MFAYLDKEQQIEYVFNQGQRQGLEQGLKQGVEQGIEQGQLLTLMNLAEKKNITTEQAAEEAGISEDEFLLFLYQQQEDAYRETLKTVRLALKGENILGSFNSVEEMVVALRME